MQPERGRHCSVPHGRRAGSTERHLRYHRAAVHELRLARANPIGDLVLRALSLATLLPLIACRTVTSTRPGFVEPKPPSARHSVRSTDGLAIAYDARGKGETAVLFIHCWACDRTFWNRQVDVFRHEYRVVTLDLAGHGASGRDRRSWTIPRLAADVRTVIEHLRLTRVVLVGHSLGGPVALEAARLLPSHRPKGLGGDGHGGGGEQALRQLRRGDA
jgi:hypothetical protein